MNRAGGLAARIWPELTAAASFSVTNLTPCLRHAMRGHPIFAGALHLGFLLVTRTAIHFKE